MSIKVGKSFKALIAAGAALVMAASMAACGPSAGTPSEAKSSDTGTSSSANASADRAKRCRDDPGSWRGTRAWIAMACPVDCLPRNANGSMRVSL